jgi:hydroxymethylpyrimidine/phosphomethylpyrimidine kinase
MEDKMENQQPQKPVVLLIGGVDPQGCAGLTADITTA